MIRRPPRSTRTDTLFPYTTLFRSVRHEYAAQRNRPQAAQIALAFSQRPCRTYQPWYGIRCEASSVRSEEHTSELQSLMRISYAVFCLKKKTKKMNDKVNEYIYRKREQNDSITYKQISKTK